MCVKLLLVVYRSNKIRIRQKGRQMLGLLVGGRTWMPHKPFSSKDDSKKSFWKNIHLGRVVVGCSVTRWSSIFRKYPFRQVAVSLVILFFKSSCAKWLVRHGIKSVPSPNQQRRPLPSLLSESSSMTLTFDPEHVVRVDMVYPLAGALPDDSPHPQREVRRHQVDKSKPELTYMVLRQWQWKSTLSLK